MKRIILAALAAVFPALAYAADPIWQGSTFDANTIVGYSAKTGAPPGFKPGGASSEPNVGFAINGKGTGQLQFNNATFAAGIIANPNSSFTQPLFIGYNAGAAYPIGTTSTTDYSSVGIGAGTLQSLTALGAEATCFGTWACQYLTTGTLDTGIGMHALGATIIGSGHTAIGNDAMRNGITPGGFVTAVGQAAAASGSPGTGAVAVGASSLKGNSGSIRLTGSTTTSDVITVSVSSSAAGVTGSPATATHTVNSGTDTLTTIAVDLASQLTTMLNGPSYTMFAKTVGPNIYFEYPGDANGNGWATTINYSVTGAATEVGTVTNGFAGTQNVAVGDGAVICLVCGNVHDEAALGYNAGLNELSGTFNTFLGSVAGGALTSPGLTGGGNVFVGARTAWNITGNAAHNTMVGQGAGATAGTVSNVTLLGQNVGGTTLTSGSDIIIIGDDSHPDTNTSHTLLIQGAGTTPSVQCTGINATPLCMVPGSLQVGSATAATLAQGEFDLTKISASGSAPGAGNLKLAVVGGTSGGTCKIIAYAGTSTTPTTVIDNVGSGC